MKTFRPLAFLLVFATALASALFAQGSATGTIVGRVSDASAKLALHGVRVTVQGSTVETYTDAAGAFVLTGVPAGARSVEFSYIGYGDLTRSAEVRAGGVTTLDVMFGEETVRMKAVVIEGNAVGSARAINQQRAADTLTNIIAADAIGRFPDQNAAESMQRVPGLALYRDQGEGRFIVVRGIRPDLNSTQLNGVSIASPERGSRTVALDVLPTDALGSVEVTKVPTPDQDVDGLGGRINLKTRSPFDAQGRQLQLSAQGQYNHLRDRLSGKYNATYADTFDGGKLGIIFSPTWQGRRFGSDNFEVSNPWVLRAIPGSTAQTYFNQDINYREYEITRTRYGANGGVEYKPDAASLYYARATYSYFSDHENRYVTTIPFSEGTVTSLTDTSATVTGVRRENKQLRVRTKTQDLYSFSVGGERALAEWKLEAHAAYSLGKESKPEESAIFRKSARGTDWSYSFASGTYAPLVTQTGGPTINDAAVFTEFNRLRSAPGTGKETEANLGADARRDFRVGGDLPAFVKFGGQTRLKRKTQEREQVNWTPPASFTFASLAQPQTADDYAFTTGPRFNAEAFTKTFIDNKAAFTPLRDLAASSQDDWTSDEDVYAAYGMGGVTFGTTSLSTGLRYERTEFEARGNDLRTAGGALAITPGRRSRSYDNFLPGLYLRSTFDKRTVLRASWSNSLARPAFGDSAFRRSVSDDNRTVTESNPRLKALTSVNYDASVEHYFASLGTVSAAVFHKEIKNFTYQAALPGVSDPATGYGLTTFVNGPRGHISGLELAWQQQFQFLPAPFDGFGAFVNFTVTDSSARYLRANGELREARRVCPARAQLPHAAAPRGRAHRGERGGGPLCGHVQAARPVGELQTEPSDRALWRSAEPDERAVPGVVWPGPEAFHAIRGVRLERELRRAVEIVRAGPGRRDAVGSPSGPAAS
ncbi:MAG: TonB-dependent receptor [Verrucomicrobia bacterium]|nr:TonB-dependent receptor [Verrucomicrobiota bacterium]